MKNKLLSLLAALFALSTLTAFADLPFRNHRYDAFKALKVTPDNIVFMGNSITNMHEWCDAFDNHLILNRGVSGGYTQELLNTLENVVAGKPKKLFLMIGTNDLGTAGINNTAYVAGNIEVLVERVQRESPQTEIYVQSILPSNSGLRTLELLSATNEAVKAMCERKGVTYIDLWDDMLPIVQGAAGGLSLDNLHPTAKGYRIWCKRIAPYVGAECVYPDEADNNFGGHGGSYGMRVSSMAMAGVKAGDIVLIGDEMVHGGEWHELLQSAKVKNRGTGWGYPGMDIAGLTKEIEPILKGRADNGEPAKIALYAGTPDLNNANNSLDKVYASYLALVEKVRLHAPGATIYLQALLPRTNAQHNAARVVPFNEKLKALAESMAGVEYVDQYSPLVKNGVADPACFKGDYVYATGYVKIAGALADAFGDKEVVAVSEAEAQARYERHTLRNDLGAAITKVLLVPAGTKPGQYPAEAVEGLRNELAQTYALLEKENLSAAEITAETERLNAEIEKIYPQLVKPLASNGAQTYLYTIKSARRNNLFIRTNGAGKGLSGTAVSRYAETAWKFVERTDGTLDIVSAADGSYVNPAANYNTQIAGSSEAPERGWELSHSNSQGLFIIYSNTTQLNMTGSEHGHAVYNWSAGKDGRDRDDAGCALQIELVAGTPVPAPALPMVSNAETSHYYTLFSGLRGQKDIVPKGKGAALAAVAPAEADTAHHWKFEARADGSYDIVSRLDGAYLSPAATLNAALTCVAAKPASGWRLNYSAADGYFYISSGTTEMHITRQNTVINWSASGKGNDADDEGCQFKVNFAESAPTHVFEPEPVVLPEALLTLVGLELDGTQPYHVPDELAAPVLAADAVTVAVDFTAAVAPTGSGAAASDYLVAASDENAADRYFGVIIRERTKYGVHYYGNPNGLEGWYSHAGKDFTQGAKVVMAMQPEGNAYSYYLDGAFGRSIAVGALGQYGYVTFGNVENVTALFVGGVVTADNPNKYAFTGTIRSLQIFPGALTAEQVAAINYDNLKPTGIDAPAAGNAPKAAFDLGGRRVSAPLKAGVYIVNGQKVIR